MSTLEFFMHFSPSTFWSVNKKGNIADYLESLASAQVLISTASISHAVSFGIRNATTHVRRITNHSQPMGILFPLTSPLHTHTLSNEFLLSL